MRGCAHFARMKENRLSRLIAICLAALFVAATALKAPAQDSAKRVIVITAATAEIKAGTRVVSYARRGQRYRVLKTSGSWYMVKYVVNGTSRKGWILRDNVRVERFAGAKPNDARAGKVKLVANSGHSSDHNFVAFSPDGS